MSRDQLEQSTRHWRTHPPRAFRVSHAEQSQVAAKDSPKLLGGKLQTKHRLVYSSLLHALGHQVHKTTDNETFLLLLINKKILNKRGLTVLLISITHEKYVFATVPPYVMHYQHY